MPIRTPITEYLSNNCFKKLKHGVVNLSNTEITFLYKGGAQPAFCGNLLCIPVLFRISSGILLSVTPWGPFIGPWWSFLWLQWSFMWPVVVFYVLSQLNYFLSRETFSYINSLPFHWLMSCRCKIRGTPGVNELGTVTHSQLKRSLLTSFWISYWSFC